MSDAQYDGQFGDFTREPRFADQDLDRMRTLLANGEGGEGGPLDETPLEDNPGGGQEGSADDPDGDDDADETEGGDKDGADAPETPTTPAAEE